MLRSTVPLETTDRGPRTQSDRGERCSEGGFVLVGVVMFVLALTILGLSLFSLSGYEAQFMTASYRRTQLFYDAMSGIDRTKYVLSTSGRLEAASSNFPLPGFPSVVMAQAVQNGESTGVVVWSDPSKHISIRVRAEQPGRPSENVTLEASYVPQSDQSLYRDLIATTGRIAVYHDPDLYEYDNIAGCGHSRNPDPSDWSGQIPQIIGLVDYAGAGVPVPKVQDFISEWQPSSIGSPVVTSGGTQSYRFDLSSRSYRIFSGPRDPKSGFDLWDAATDSITFDVGGSDGTVVWLLPAGACFERWVTVTGAPSCNLVIVAGKSTNTTYSAITGADPGLWFQGGISSTGPSLFLVSDGTVALDRWVGTSHENSIPFLAVFSGGVYLRGPLGGAGYIRKFVMTHCGNDDAILNPLYEAGLLPNTRGRTKTFALVPGSFMETTDSNPPN